MEPPFARTIDAAKKYVVSSSLDGVDWNVEFVRGDLGMPFRSPRFCPSVTCLAFLSIVGRAPCGRLVDYQGTVKVGRSRIAAQREGWQFFGTALWPWRSATQASVLSSRWTVMFPINPYIFPSRASADGDVGNGPHRRRACDEKVAPPCSMRRKSSNTISEERRARG